MPGPRFMPAASVQLPHELRRLARIVLVDPVRFRCHHGHGLLHLRLVEGKGFFLALAFPPRELGKDGHLPLQVYGLAPGAPGNLSVFTEREKKLYRVLHFPQ